MNHIDLHYQTALSMLYGVGPRRARELVSLLGSLEELFTLSPTELAKLTGYKKKFFQQMNFDQALSDASKIVSFHLKKKIESIFYTDETYPRRLENCIDAPINLYRKGSLNLNDYKFVAIVGTRNSTNYGREICRELIESFKGKNIAVISGLAHGIDSIAHKYCLEYDVPTIAVLGHGLDRIYPANNRNLAKLILEKGALITEFGPGTQPDKENFPKRNRIVAGMCDATIVVESKTRGGSLITAYLANDYNRDVFAFPGDVNKESSQGCNALISKQAAHLIQKADDFLTMMDWKGEDALKNKQLKMLPELSILQKKIVDLIIEKPMAHIDSIAVQLEVPISRLNVELFNLQLSGVIVELPGKRYKLI